MRPPSNSCPENRRILLIDDNPEIHRDIIRVLQRRSEDPLPVVDPRQAEQFGILTKPLAELIRPYEISSAYQGEEGLALAREALEAGHPFVAAFVDCRMPPGWDGVQTIRRLWELCPQIQITICTAYADYTWEQIMEILGGHDNLTILKKPFDVIELQQIAEAMVRRWSRNNLAELQITQLEKLLIEIHDHAPPHAQRPNDPEFAAKTNGGGGPAGDRIDVSIEKSRQLVRQLQSRAHASRYAIVGRLAAALRSHRLQLGAFGRRLPDFLSLLAEKLQSEEIATVQLLGALQSTLDRLHAGYHASHPQPHERGATASPLLPRR